MEHPIADPVARAGGNGEGGCALGSDRLLVCLQPGSGGVAGSRLNALRR